MAVKSKSTCRPMLNNNQVIPKYYLLHLKFQDFEHFQSNIFSTHPIALNEVKCVVALISYNLLLYLDPSYFSVNEMFIETVKDDEK